MKVHTRIAGGMVVMAMLTLATPARAFHPALPVLMTESFAGNGWAAYRFTADDGAALSAEIMTTFDDDPSLGQGIWFLHEDGSNAGGMLLFSSPGVSAEAYIEGPEPIGVVVDHRARVGYGGDSFVVIDFESMIAGDYIVLVLSTTDGTAAQSTAALYGEGITLGTSARGANAWMYRERDFHGINAIAGASLARTKVVAGGELMQSIAGRLFGWFGTPFDPLTFAEYYGPNGGAIGREFYFYGEGPGDYRFGIGLNAGVGDLFYFGADVALP